MYRVGYHYTSLAHWMLVEKQGLQPYAITRSYLRPWFGSDTVQGIWVYEERRHGIANTGSVMYEMACSGTTAIALLEVLYDPDDCLSPSRSVGIVFNHTAEFDQLEVETGKFVIVGASIPADSIRLLELYRLDRAWKDPVGRPEEKGPNEKANPTSAKARLSSRRRLRRSQTKRLDRDGQGPQPEG